MKRYKLINKQKIISFFVSAAILISSFSGCSQQGREKSNETNQDSGSVLAINTSGSDNSLSASQAMEFLPYEAGVKYITDFSDIKSWEGDVEMPLFNPLGEKEKYSFVEFKKNINSEWEWVDKDNRLAESKICGDSWKLKATNYSSKADFLFLMDSYGIYKNMNFHGCIKEDERMYSFDDENGVTWWTSVKVGDKEAIFTIIREFRLKPGVSVTLNRSDLERNDLWFNTQKEDNGYMTLRVEMDQGTVKLESRQNKKYDSYNRMGNFQKILDTREGNVFVLNDIPQDPGTWNWKLTWSEKSGPQTLTLTLEATPEL